jgi:2-C-methyl-D-erythritol 4-phosphate cytidylyltransferase
LEILSGDGWVIVHDAVRPFLSHTLLARCLQIAEEKGSAVPVLPVVDSLRRGEYHQSRAVERKYFYRVQTPQVFDCRTLKKAYQQRYRDSFTDDASVVEADGSPVFLVDGDARNIKITDMNDYAMAESYTTLFENL